ncbi:MAG: hypothetical protein ACFB10_09530 [Salibacteraceae bacterium]
MDQIFTLDDLAKFNQQEKQILASLGLTDPMEVAEEPQFRREPKKATIDNLLSFSKVLSVRNSSLMGTIEMVLN